MLVALLFLLLQTPPSAAIEDQNSDAFELHGDILGENLKTFVARHISAECMDLDKHRVTCYQWKEVEILGLIAHPGPDCSLKSYSAPQCVQGVTAQFADDRLISLSYSVAGTDKREAVAELKKSFGAPLVETAEATMWSRGGYMASVVVGKADPAADGPVLITFMIAKA